MKTIKVPELWLLVLIVGLPQLSETVYTPALPDIAHSLGTTDSFVEYTLTIFLFGFALGTLFWGKLSDKIGRKIALLVGILVYIVGCVSCFFSRSISALMVSRLIQAFGGSAGSVLGQVICRDVFHGARRGKIFSIISSGLAFAPAVGPCVGGIIDQFFGWSAIFLFLIMVGLFTFLVSFMRLPETYTPVAFSLTVIKNTFLKMIGDVNVGAFGFLVAACSGISFSYYAEGSFCLMKILGMSPGLYGSTFIILACAGIIGSYISKRMHDRKMHSFDIALKGISLIFFTTLFFLVCTIFFNHMAFTSIFSIVLIVLSMFFIMVGIGIMIPNLLSIALEEYQGAMGTASSLFGFYYYCLISLCTAGMGLLHDHTLFPMPIYFFCIALSMYIIGQCLKYKCNIAVK